MWELRTAALSEKCRSAEFAVPMRVLLKAAIIQAILRQHLTEQAEYAATIIMLMQR